MNEICFKHTGDTVFWCIESKACGIDFQEMNKYAVLWIFPTESTEICFIHKGLC